MPDKNVKATIGKIVLWLAGENNQKINDWVNADEVSFKKIIEFMNRCAENGWVNVTDSPFDYLDDKAVEIAEELYKSAMKHFGGGK